MLVVFCPSVYFLRTIMVSPLHQQVLRNSFDTTFIKFKTNIYELSFGYKARLALSILRSSRSLCLTLQPYDSCLVTLGITVMQIIIFGLTAQRCHPYTCWLHSLTDHYHTTRKIGISSTRKTLSYSFRSVSKNAVTAAAIIDPP